MHVMMRAHGTMPASGSYGEQPSKLMRLIDIASMEVGKLEDARNKDRK